MKRKFIIRRSFSVLALPSTKCWDWRALPAKGGYAPRRRVAALSFILLFFIPFYSIGQAFSPIWEKTFGGINDDIGYSVCPVQGTKDEYVITGSTSSFGNGFSDVYLIKIDADGDAVWTKTFGGRNFDYSYSVQQTSDGGFIITGYTSSFGAGYPDVYLIKTDSMGDTLWTKTFGDMNYEYGRSVCQTDDGGYVIAGYTSSFGSGGADVYLIRTNGMGDTLWTKTFGGRGTDIGWSVQQTTDEGYIITGSTNNFKTGNIDVYLIRTDIDGKMLWEKTYGGKEVDIGYSVQQTADEGFIITGKTSSFGEGFTDVYLIKTDAGGDILWSKTFGGAFDDYGNSVYQIADGGYVITGETYSFGAGNADVYLIRTDTIGNELWSTSFGGADDDIGYSIHQNLEGGYIIAGSTKSFGTGKKDAFLIKVKDKISQRINYEPGSSEDEITKEDEQSSSSGVSEGSTELQETRNEKNETDKENEETGENSDSSPDLIEEVLADRSSSPEIIYRVQFLLTVKPIDPHDTKYAGIIDIVSEQTGEKVFKHMVGACSSLYAANKLQNKIRAKGYKDAFVVAYSNGKRITVKKALGFTKK